MTGFDDQPCFQREAAPKASAVKTFEVILRRANGRFVKAKTVTSKYAAKSLRKKWEAEHDVTYYVEVEER